jgi:EAL domain-containing protein (putative c-di-GMP-specific phosphodiesterase class I)/ActR/RegA family two-component response regulator
MATRPVIDPSLANKAPSPVSEAELPASVLLVDDDQDILEYYSDVLKPKGYQVQTASDGKEAIALAKWRRYDVIVSDISMPGMDGITFLRTVRETNLDVPVILATADPRAETAIRAVEYGAFRYLTKPVGAADLRKVVEYAVCLNRMARAKREALMVVSGVNGYAGDRAGLEASFERAMSTTWMAYQPIVSWSKKNVIGYEALARTGDPTLSSPLALIETAEKVGRLVEMGRAFRAMVASTLHAIPESASVFVNVHPKDFDDEDLFSPAAPLSKSANRVVLEITERASMELVSNAQARIAQLRKMGYRIAIDDLGAGHAGLATFARLEPDVVKIDMALTRGVDTNPTKQKVIRSLTSLCQDLNMMVVIEGVETQAERDAVIGVGCDALQGFLFGFPDRAIVAPRFA